MAILPSNTYVSNRLSICETILSRAIRSEITLYINWYNQHRPYQALDGRIPMDVYFGIDDEVLCFETRGEDAVAIRLVVSRLDNRKHLPVVELKRAV